MTLIASHITAFFRERLPIEQAASPHTCSSYAYTFMLLFDFASKKLDISPSGLHIEHIDAPLVLAFLEHIETTRANCPSTRNVRLAGIKSFMRFIEYRVPAALEQIRAILAIPLKRTDSKLVQYLTMDEMQAILDAPDPRTRLGIRDRAMLHVAFACGLRVSELVGLCLYDLTFSPRLSLFVRGKGRNERALPLWKETASALQAWLSVRGDASVPALFLNARGEQLSRWGFKHILCKYLKTAGRYCPSLLNKRITPHVLRHTCAMTILQATHDIRKVALWLGHASVQTSEIYTRADPMEKLNAIAAITPPSLRKGTFEPPEKLIALLKQAT
jgi:site-specific recombinase XerD